VLLKRSLFIALILLCASLILQAAIGTNTSLPDGLNVTDSPSPIHSSGAQDLVNTSFQYDLNFGAEPNPTGSPIGGGDGYQDITTVNSGVNYTVSNTEELLAALRDAGSGDVIYIDQKAQIDLNDTPGGVIIPGSLAIPEGVLIPGGVTLAGNRGERATAGSAVYSFEIEEPGEYVIWGLAAAGNGENGSFWVSLDREEFRQWDINTGSDWNWSRAGRHYLSSGQHILTIQWRDDNSNLDTIVITDRDSPPEIVRNERDTGLQVRMEAESAILSPPMRTVPDPTVSGGAYISVPEGSGRGEYPVSPGGRIFLESTVSDRGYMVGLIIGGENVRITGLRIEGPHKTTGSVSPTTVGMITSYRNLEVDNCEIFGWSNAAIGLIGTGGSDMKAGAYIHHNYIHHNQNADLGYGISVSNGATALIEANYFDYCRHGIAGAGNAGDGYEARYNICGPNWDGISPHNFDMHGKPDPDGSGTIAGDTIKIHHNTFLGTASQMPTCIAIRGVPRDGAYIDHNWFYFTRDAPVWQTGGKGNISVTDNLIGADGQFSASGPIRYY